MNNSDFHSQAFNFSSAVQGSVDPRTGLYMLNMPLLSLQGNDQRGPEFNLSLNYNPLSQADNGLGIGISTGLSVLDRYHNSLSLSTGEQYRLIPGTDEVRHQKVDSFRLSWEGSAYQITHKNGNVEWLTEEGNDIWLPTRLFSPAGHSLYLEWDAGSGIPWLYRVTDDSGTELCNFTYYGSEINIQVLGGTSASYHVDLLLTNGFLEQVISYCNQDLLVWTLDYDWIDPQQNGLWGVTGISGPTGLKESVIYDRVQGMLFPVLAGYRAALPRAIEYRQDPGAGQPAMISTFDYSDYNYLGRESDIQNWAPASDCMLGALTDYTYSSTETVTNADGSATSTLRSWNRYHLQILESVTHGECTQETETRYHALPYVEFSDQPVNCLQPYEIRQHWYRGDESRSLTSISEFDETHGNLIKEIKPDGTITEYDYYPANGTGSDCPADPFGFTRHMRSTTTTPVQSAWGDEPVVRTEYHYQKLKSLAPEQVPYQVVLSVVTHKINSQIRFAETLIWHIDDGINFGRIKVKRQTRYGESSEQWSSEQAQEVALLANQREMTITATTRMLATDGKTGLFEVTNRDRVCRYTGRKLAETDAAGNQIEYIYDPLGRILTITEHPDRPYYRSVESWQYISPKSGAAAHTIHIDTDGNMSRMEYDGFGRELALYTTARDREDVSMLAAPVWLQIAQNQYDSRGFLITSRWQDVLYAQTSSPQTISGSKTYKRDEWDNVCAVTGHDDVTHYSDKDPIRLTTTSWSSGDNGRVLSGWQTVHYDHNQQPVKAETFSSDGKLYSTTTQAWDSIQRLRKVTDELGRETTYDYDDEGRVIRTCYPDGSVVSKGYAPFSVGDLPVSISLTDNKGVKRELGTQTFDRLGRLTETFNGGRRTTMRWNQPWQSTPSSVTTADGVVKEYLTDSALGEAVTNITAGNIAQSFDYQRTTGRLNAAIEQNTTLRWQNYLSGRLQSESSNIENGLEIKADYVYSLAGVQEQETGSDNHQRNWRFGLFGSSAGQLKEVIDGQTTVTLHYDGLQRMTGWTAFDASSKQTLTTSLSLDDFGRETQRVLAHSNGTSQTIVQQWNSNNQLATRIIWQESSKKTGPGSLQRHHAQGARHHKPAQHKKMTKKHSHPHLHSDQHQRGNQPRAALLLCEENFTYDLRNRLIHYTASGAQLPQDSYGNSITDQTFTFDALGNITSCITILKDGRTNGARYHFENAADPCQLTSVTHSLTAKKYGYPARIELKYDAAGRLIQDEAGRQLSYDRMGRLSNIIGAGSYGYDAQNRLAWQLVDKTAQLHRLYYRSNQLVSEWLTADKQQQNASKDSRVRLVYAAGSPVAQVNRDSSSEETTLTATDGKLSVISAHTANQSQHYRYTPYGEQTESNDSMSESKESENE